MPGEAVCQDLVEHYVGGVPVEVEEVEDVDVAEDFVLRGLAEYEEEVPADDADGGGAGQEVHGMVYAGFWANSLCL